MGSAIATADEIPDPQTLDIVLRVNGIEKQRSNTQHMIFGVGSARKPPEFLRPGDVVEAEIGSIGLLRTFIGEPGN